MSIEPPPLLIGTMRTTTDPGLLVGNASLGWTDLFSHHGVVEGAAGITPVVLGVADQMTSGAANDSGTVLVSVDQNKNIGIRGALSLAGVPQDTTTSPTIGVGTDDPTTAPALGSVYLRTDSDLRTRLFLYQSSANKWLPVPTGLNVFNVMEYGAAGDGSESTTQQQAAVNAAVAASGGIIFYPPGEYLTNGGGTRPVVIPDTPLGITFAGAGDATNIFNAVDFDMFLVTGSASSVTFRDLQFNGPGIDDFPVAPTSGAAVHFVGDGGEFNFINVDISDTAYGVNVENPGAVGSIVGCKIKGTYIGAYLQSETHIHHTHINGGTYGLIMDGSSGVRMMGVALFGALSLAMRNTTAVSGANTLHAFDVEANYGAPPSGLAHTFFWPVEGCGSSSLVANGGQIALSECWFQGSTVIGGNVAGQTYVPSIVTIDGGNFSVSGPDKYVGTGSPGPLDSNALNIAQASNVTVRSANFGTGPNASGYAIYVQPDVDNISIVGNNVTDLHRTAAGAIFLAPSGGVNCQNNIIATSPPASGISWPAFTAQPFTIANNPGFNPTGLPVVQPPPTAGVPWTLMNTHGVPGAFYITPHGTTITSISIYDAQTATYRATGATQGAFRLEPGGQLQVVWHGLGSFKPQAVFIGE